MYGKSDFKLCLETVQYSHLDETIQTWNYSYMSPGFWCYNYILIIRKQRLVSNIQFLAVAQILWTEFFS